MQVINLRELSNRGKWCTLGGSIIMVLASLAFWIMIVAGSRISMLSMSIGARADALTAIIVALIISLLLILVGTLHFGRYDDVPHLRHRWRA